MAATSWWIHQSIVSGDTIKPKASRLLPGRFTRAYRFLDDQGDHMQVAVYATGDSIQIIDIHFDKPDAPPLQGAPAELLKEWQEKLALKLNGIALTFNLPLNIKHQDKNRCHFPNKSSRFLYSILHF